MSRIAVLGIGTVGRAAAWDLVRRGHEVTVADSRPGAARRVAQDVGAASADIVEASDREAVTGFVSDQDVVVSAVPYVYGEAVAAAAIAGRTHYLDFGGNPAVVAAQLAMDQAARDAGVSLVPDCGLAPGLANVMAKELWERLGGNGLDEVRIRVGALPAQPVGELAYQWAFNPIGLINEYAEPCEVLIDGEYATVEPLTGLEEVEWPGWGPLEAFHTAGGSSTLPRLWARGVAELDYKTLRYPGHCAAFRAMRQIGLFDDEPQPGSGAAPRAVLVEALDRHLPRDADDVVLIRVWARKGARVEGLEVEDRHDDTFSALARTTAFPTTALAHMIATGGASPPGAHAMHGAVDASPLLGQLEEVGIRATPWP